MLGSALDGRGVDAAVHDAPGRVVLARQVDVAAHRGGRDLVDYQAGTADERRRGVEVGDEGLGEERGGDGHDGSCHRMAYF